MAPPPLVVVVLGVGDDDVMQQPEMDTGMGVEVEVEQIRKE